jgi:ankyrin repeat protein
MLLQAKANPDLQDKFGGTAALMEASSKGHKDVVSILLQAKANPDLRAKDGRTALSFAKEKNQTEIIDLLLKAGAK